MQDNIVFSSMPIEIAEYDTFKLATFMISVLDEYDQMGRMITREAGEKYHSTIVGFPIVAKLVTDYNGNPIDFKGHEVSKTFDKKHKSQFRFGTTAIGSVVESWIEERYLPDYDGVRACIMIKAKLWKERFPEFFKVLDQLWQEGNVKSSWEIKVEEFEETSFGKILKVFSFIGNALLGRSVMPAVKGAGMYEYASNEVDDLIKALTEDVYISEKEGSPVDNNETIVEQVVEETDHTEEASVPEAEGTTTESAQAVEETPSVEDEIAKLRAEIAQRDNALVEANVQIQSLLAEISELRCYKDEHDERVRRECEAANEAKKKCIREYAKRSGLISDDEIASGNIADMIEALDEAGIKQEIANRFMQTLSVTEVESASVSERIPESNLESDEITGNIIKAFINKK